MHDDIGAERQRLLQVGRGERVVDASAAPRSWAISQMTPMSKQRSSGLVGVSNQTSFVSLGHSAINLSMSIGLTALHVRVGMHLVDQPERAAVRVVTEQYPVAGAQ